MESAPPAPLKALPHTYAASAGAGEVPVHTKIILSSHNFTATPPAAELRAQAKRMYEAGADIVKIATMAGDITDAAVMLSLLQDPVGKTGGGI